MLSSCPATALSPTSESPADQPRADGPPPDLSHPVWETFSDGSNLLSSVLPDTHFAMAPTQNPWLGSPAEDSCKTKLTPGISLAPALTPGGEGGSACPWKQRRPSTAWAMGTHKILEEIAASGSSFKRLREHSQGWAWLGADRRRKRHRPVVPTLKKS